MHSDNCFFLLLKMASTTHATFKNMSLPHLKKKKVERWFKYQNNEQNFQIWDMQISHIAKFKTHFVGTGHIYYLPCYK